MITTEKTILTVEATINAPVPKVWRCWTEPKHITQWNNASDDWFTPRAENDLRPGGKFNSRMEARDGSMGFDFEGIYDEVIPYESISYTMADGRKVNITFQSNEFQTTVIEKFEAEMQNSLELQQTGWQAIMDNFKRYVESVDLRILYFDIHINANVEKVYQTMLEKKTYTEWTAEFNPSSYYVGSWERGSKILFIGTDEKGEKGGMVSRIKENIPNQYVSIEHIGLLQGDNEITSGQEVEKWAGALENYKFEKVNGGTSLNIDMDSNQEYESYFTDTWPKALNKLKAMCER